MSKTAQKVLAYERTQLGVTESPKNSNRTKYGAAYGMNGVPWCCIFQWYSFRECGMSDLFGHGKKFASCNALIKDMKSQFTKGSKGIKPGDLVFFNFDKIDDADHIGICESITSTSITTIDGNTSEKGSQDNGGAVCRRTRGLSNVYGYIRPKYDETTPTVTIVIAKPTLYKKIDNVKEVKHLQENLNHLGIKDKAGKKLVVDGSFGNSTEYAVKAFQKKYGLKIDGRYGPESYSKMKSVCK